MQTAACRLLPYAVADGPHNMAADEALLESAGKGVASLRFYGWQQATLSLGYFQPERLRLTDPLLASLPFVRRPTGGATLVHDQELTYALALPADPAWQRGESWLSRMHGILARALATLDVPTPSQAAATEHPFDGLLCFQHLTQGDLLIKSAKVAGSAQRKQRRALLQHGALLLAQSRYTPALPGIQELCGRKIPLEDARAAIVREFTHTTGWPLRPTDWKRLRPGIEGLLHYHEERLPKERQRFLGWWKGWRCCLSMWSM